MTEHYGEPLPPEAPTVGVPDGCFFGEERYH